MKNTQYNDVIVAQCTPRGSGALAVVRFSGAESLSLVGRLSKLPQNKKLETQPSHTIHYGWVVDHTGAPIDQVMFSIMHAPRTFTGENTVEISCHNNQGIIETIIEEAMRHGARIARNGEFAQRAFHNGKLDLIQAEALNELIHAQTQQALKKSLAQLEGTFSRWVQNIEHELIRVLAWCEASFEFLDEEEEFGDHIKIQLEQILAVIASTKKSFDIRRHIRQGVRIALVGAVNAGKSSLFNCLLGTQRAIVTAIPGTTRDVIEAITHRGGNAWTLVDTAGIRTTHDVIEAEGIMRSRKEAATADIVLLVYDRSRELTNEEREIYQSLLAEHAHKIIVVATKSDLPQKARDPFGKTLVFSSATGENHDLLLQCIEEKVHALLMAHDSPFLLNERQYNLILALEKNIQTVFGMILLPVIQYELVSYHLREALEQSTELTGKTISEASMDQVFREFCIGK